MYLSSVRMWIQTESAKRRNPMQIHLITSFPWPAPMETMARVVPYMGMALHFAQRARTLIPSRFTIRAFADDTQGPVYMISFSLSLCCNVNLCGNDNTGPTSRHESSTAASLSVTLINYLFIYSWTRADLIRKRKRQGHFWLFWKQSHTAVMAGSRFNTDLLAQKRRIHFSLDIIQNTNKRQILGLLFK